MNGVHSLNRKQNWLTIETSATKTEKTKKGETIKAALKIILGSEALGLKISGAKAKRKH
jgi:tRNA G18 (ribose-2'-O)-methylase SpoU